MAKLGLKESRNCLTLWNCVKESEGTEVSMTPRATVSEYLTRRERRREGEGEQHGVGRAPG